jgi:hypothetical protein
MTQPDVLKDVDLDINDYKTVSLGITHIKSMKYPEYVTRLQRMNPDKSLNSGIVEACFWNDIHVRIGVTGARGSQASDIVKQAKSVLGQRELRAYWDSA